jgi:hypothetical protein
MVVALLALSIAMAGISYAAIQLPANSVASKQTQANAVAAAPCDRGGATVVRASRQAVVVRWRANENRRHYWACLRSTRRAVLLGFDGYQGADEYVLSNFSLGGRFVAAVNYSCLEGCGSEQVAVFDLRSRRRVRSLNLGETWDHAAKVLLGTRGAVVLVEAESARVGARRRIRVRDSRGWTVVTQGPPKHIPLASTRVHGNLLRWRQAGMEHSFRMR